MLNAPIRRFYGDYLPLQTTVTEANFVGLSSKGSQVYARLLETGAQIWVHVWNGTIRDGGRNEVPWSVAELLQ